MFKLPKRRVRLIVFGTILATILASANVGKPASSSAPSINEVQFYPRDIVTPRDRPFVRANVTSEVGIADVSIYFKTGRAGLTFKTISEYEKRFMFRSMGSVYNGFWEHQFENQSADTTIYFFIVATDSAGTNSTWYDFLAPHAVSVEEAPVSSINAVYFYLNDIMLNNLFQAANISAHVDGCFPDPPEWYAKTLFVKSNERYVANLNVFEYRRFYYAGEASGIADIQGNFWGKPYDKYDLEITIEIPFIVKDLRGVPDRIPLFSRSFPGYDMWEISWVSQSVGNSTDGQKTLVQARYELARHPPDFYPPLVLMLATLAVLGMAPLASTVHGSRRFEVFFAAIALVATALLSDTINPFGAFQSNVFEILFAVILLSTIIMMAVSILSSRLKSHQLMLEGLTVLVITVLISVTVATTTLPSWAMILSPIALISGSVLLILVDRQVVLRALKEVLQVLKTADTGIGPEPDRRAISTPVSSLAERNRKSGSQRTLFKKRKPQSRKTENRQRRRR